MAIILSGEALAQAEKIKLSLHMNFGLKGALLSPAHITLHRPFEWREEKETQLREKLRSFRAAAPGRLRLKGFDSFGKRVVFIAVKQSYALLELHGKLKSFASRELGLLNEWEDERGFHPHVTVAFRDLKTRNFEAVKSLVEQHPVDLTLEANGFSLLRMEERWEELEYFELSEAAGAK